MWGRAGAPPRGSPGPETQSQLRKDRSGARGSGPGGGGPPAARYPPAGCRLQPALRRTRQERAGREQGGVGGGGGRGTVGCTPRRDPPARA